METRINTISIVLEIRPPSGYNTPCKLYKHHNNVYKLHGVIKYFFSTFSIIKFIDSLYFIIETLNLAY